MGSAKLVTLPEEQCGEIRWALQADWHVLLGMCGVGGLPYSYPVIRKGWDAPKEASDKTVDASRP